MLCSVERVILDNGMKTHALGFKGLRPVIAYLEAHPDRTHLLALKGPRGIHDLVVTPKRFRAVIRQLRKQLAASKQPREAVLQTL
jgi:hypothetical protein